MDKKELEKYLQDNLMQSDLLDKSALLAVIEILLNKNIINQTELQMKIEKQRNNIIDKLLEEINKRKDIETNG